MCHMRAVAIVALQDQRGRQVFFLVGQRTGVGAMVAGAKIQSTANMSVHYSSIMTTQNSTYHKGHVPDTLMSHGSTQ